MTPASSGFTNFLLAQINCAGIRARLLVSEIDCIGVALSGGFIGTDDAMTWLGEAGGLGLIAVSSAITNVSTS